MSGEKNRPDWDDGRTVADMSGVGKPNLVRPGRTDGPAPEGQSELPESPYSPQERRWAVLGALKATLLIALAFLAGLALVIAFLLWLWNR